MMSLILAMSIVTPASAQSSNQESNNEESQSLDQMRQYVSEDNGKIYIDDDILNDESLDITNEQLNEIEGYYSYLNSLSDSNEITINENLEITKNNENITTFSTQIESGTVKFRWWGFEIYLNQTDALTTAQNWQGAGTASAAVAGLTRVLAITPPTALVTGVSAAIGGAMAYYGDQIQSNTSENGVRLEIRLPMGLYAYPR